MTAVLKVVRKEEVVRCVNVSRSDIEAAFRAWDQNPHEWRTARANERAIRFGNRDYPPKEIARIAIELKEKLPIGHLQSHGLTVNNTKICFEKLSFDYRYACDTKDD